MDKLSRVGTAQDKNVTWPSLFLKERTQTAPNLRKEVSERGIENEAAMGLFTTLSILYSGGKLLSKWLNRDNIEAQANLKEVGERIDLLWGWDRLFNEVLDFKSSDLGDYQHTSISQQAIDKIKNTLLNNPEEFAFKVERAYRDLWVSTTYNLETVVNKSEENKPAQVCAIFLLGILDGLYRRSDLGNCSFLKTTSTSYHGWQYNKRGIRTIGFNLGQEESWYGHQNPLNLFNKILCDTALDQGMYCPSGNHMTFAGCFELEPSSNNLGSAYLDNFSRVGKIGVDKEVRECHLKVLARIAMYVKDCGLTLDSSWKDTVYERHYEELKQKVIRIKEALDKQT